MMNDDIWRLAVDEARWAPSTHNTQPWQFRRTGDGLEVIADGTRSLSEVDPTFRELIISGGATLHHLRVALDADGRRVAIETLPDDSDEPILARVTLAGASRPSAQTQRMLRAIRARHTDRGPYRAEELPAPLLDELRALAAQEGARLTVVDDAARRAQLGRLVEAGDRSQQRWPVLRELLAWVRIPGRHAHDGLALPALRHGARDRPRLERELVEAGPLLAVLSTPGDEPEDWLAAGQALSAVLLGATARGLSASFFDAPVEEPQLRADVGRAAGAPGAAQLLLRLGHGTEAQTSPRRPLDELLEELR